MNEISVLYQEPNDGDDFNFTDEHAGLDGDAYEVTGITTSINLSSSLKAEAAKASFVFVKVPDVIFEMGGLLHVMSGEDTVFYGYIFSVRYSHDIAVQVDAYDVMRYLKDEVFYPWPKQTLSERFSEICRYSALEAGVVDSSSYVLKPVVSEGKTLFSVLQEAIDETLQNEAKLFYVRANQRRLELIDVEYDLVDICIDSTSYISGFQYEKSIDKTTFNQIHFWREGDSKNLRLAASAVDEKKTEMWGRLRLTRKVDSGETDAQLQQRAEKTLIVHGQPTEALSLTCFGDWRVHAGCIITVSIPEMGVDYENRKFIVSSCSHSFDFDRHTMTLQLLFTGGGL